MTDSFSISLALHSLSFCATQCGQDYRSYCLEGFFAALAFRILWFEKAGRWLTSKANMFPQQVAWFFLGSHCLCLSNRLALVDARVQLERGVRLSGAHCVQCQAEMLLLNISDLPFCFLTLN